MYIFVVRFSGLFQATYMGKIGGLSATKIFQPRIIFWFVLSFLLEICPPSNTKQDNSAPELITTKNI